MKRLILAAVITAAAMLALAGTAGAATIMAGQNTPAGTVAVTNDATNLYVAITIDSGWCMTQSQVAVATDPMGLPTTKKGNPQPGQFPYKTTYSGCVQSGSYTIPLATIGASAGSTAYVAAHVDLYMADEKTVSAVSHVGETVYGPLEAYAGPSDGAWAGVAKTAVVPNFASLGVWPSLTSTGLESASWITTAATTELPTTGVHVGTGLTDDSWRKATFTLTVPAGSYVSPGQVIAVTSDNAEETYHNGTLIGQDGTMQGPGTDQLEWKTISPGYVFNPVDGANTFTIIWRNYGSLMGLDLTPASNPNGLVYGVSIKYHTPTNHGETGWAGGPGSFGFEGSNWATYFTYPVS